MGDAPPPGFYEDDSGRQRWWDGDGWSEQRMAAPEQASKGSLWVTAPGLFLSALSPPLGLVYGLLMKSSRHPDANFVMWFSFGMFMLYLVILVAVFA
jgi:hypothetical protein